MDKIKSPIGRIFIHLVLILFAIYSLVPFFWTTLPGTLKTSIGPVDGCAANAPGRPTGARPFPASRWSAGIIGNTSTNRDHGEQVRWNWTARGLW